MQSNLLSAVSAVDSPALRMWAYKNLGVGVPPSSPFWPLIQNTKQQLLQSLTVVRLRPPAPRLVPPNPFTPAFRTFLQDQKRSETIQKALDLETARQQRQLLDWLWRDQVRRQLVLDQLLRELWQADQNELQFRLTDADPLTRWAAVLVIARKRLPLEADLIELVTDPSAEVREAARQGLVRLSRGCDFGPTPQATTGQRQRAAATWRGWLALQALPPTSPGAGKNVVTEEVLARVFLR